MSPGVIHRLGPQLLRCPARASSPIPIACLTVLIDCLAAAVLSPGVGEIQDHRTLTR